MRKEEKRKIRRVSLIFDLLCHDLKKSNWPATARVRQKKEGGLPCGFAQGQKSRPYTGKAQVKKREKSSFMAKIGDGAGVVLGGASIQEQRDLSLHEPTDSSE